MDRHSIGRIAPGLMLAALACGSPVDESDPRATAAGGGQAVAKLTAGPPNTLPETEPDDGLAEHVNENWTGDLDGMVERGFVRILTVHNPLYFTFDGVDQRGLATEMARALEEHLAKEIGRVRSPTVVLIPVARDHLLSGLREGRGDLVAANLTITPERKKLVSFSKPMYPDVSELVITGPAAPDIASFDDLTKTMVHLRRSSSYFEHIEQLNAKRRADGALPIPVEMADEYLEDYDLLEMLNAGMLLVVVVDSHKARFWTQVFPEIRVHENLAVHSGNKIGWALRKNSPKLQKSIDAFAATIRKGTLLGNMALKRYLGDADWIENALTSEHRARFEEIVPVIRRYADEYDFDWMMIAAQSYQESRFDQSKRSTAGAVGIMQILPTTAADPVVGIPDISTVENNVQAGVKYLRWLQDRYFSSDEIEPLDRMLFTLAAYNAGARNVARARDRAERMGFDENRWFGHVDIGMYRAVSGEPVSYVRNIYKYYITYRGLAQTRRQRDAAREATGGRGVDSPPPPPTEVF